MSLYIREYKPIILLTNTVRHQASISCTQARKKTKTTERETTTNMAIDYEISNKYCSYLESMQ